MKKLIIPFVLIFSLTHSDCFFAAPEAVSHEKLKLREIKSKINQLKSSISKARDQRTNLVGQLQKTDAVIGSIKQSLTGLNTQLVDEKKALQTLQQTRVGHRKNLMQQQNLLMKQIKNAYLLREQTSYKLILCPHQLSETNRMLTYADYFDRNALASIKTTQQALISVEHNQKEVSRRTLQLQAIRDQKNSQQQSLSRLQQHNQQLVTQLNKTISSKDETLKTLIANEHALSQLITRLKSSPCTAITGHEKFALMQHKLIWPAPGKIIQHFGARLGGTAITANGIAIRPIGAAGPVAIYPGRVVFADWLKGFGLLIIVDHNDGFMSLYARNQTLYKKVGDVVRAGELLAAVGHTSADIQNGLYFELRHQGKPLNPELWLRSMKA